MTSVLVQLQEIRNKSGKSQTTGLSDSLISKFSEIDHSLCQAIDEANSNQDKLLSDFGKEILDMDEVDLISLLQDDYVNFYSKDTINPYVAISARGPWIITSHGAVLHDNGGYGMLGMGHGPETVISTMKENWVMANIMTPSFSHKRLSDNLKQEVGHKRGHCPFKKFVCLNSGSESVTISLRISDVNSYNMTSPGGRHEGKNTKLLALTQGFHGRTDRPAQISDSCKAKYDSKLASFRDRDNLILVNPNDISGLQDAFSEANKNGDYIELMAIEPVMGEGNPGLCITREFYDEARRLCNENDTLLLVDSIQAGLRGQGCLSIVDYVGFEDCESPDMETWSKALNAGQYPLSVVGLSERAANLYAVGIYGNTMTTNPRALETAVAVLDNITPQLRNNIVDRGIEFLEKLNALSEELPGCITKVQGTGLLLSAELDPTRFTVVGPGLVEEWCRCNGLGIIHGGENAIRFTPHFGLTSAEIDLIISILKDALIHFSQLDTVEPILA
jgi:acetylornithine/succinyldiaminopimelate/putrescine aminotransferase